ncbi:cobalamin adenosyltransferase [Hymenobacter qilianensis]|uniref:Cobalamin adenosyltransferase n=2 Tax=Hymenobacter qilianensis TaxID=1385715 RepID=A0ACB5PLM2_9BACT|nr:cob(I)yrinic acid a,c-diamide adenosyltransferase [Hymenobacter qilianensis]QNP50875.1 cob(I)yrinic acid a,c-diamide adenosyltransferase [Hymenobacter qilianensis]GGF49893.1 cobalamin adenosyltransferase [Hymenobacter qilianensis]
MKIYTKTGDKGLTSLIGGTRVSKASLRIESYGTVDELNSYIGLVRDQEINAPRRDLLKEIQDRLFTIGASLASDPEKSKMKIPDLHAEDVLLLESEMDRMNEQLPELRAFILPGGHVAVSYAHIARCVCRRAERLAIHLSEESFVAELVVIYLNRLSDYLFVLSRQMAQDLGAEEVTWKARL